MPCIPLVACRAARLDVGNSTSTVRVPWQGTLCVPCQVELRSRHIEAGSTGLPRERGARHQGRPSFGYFSWPRKKSNQLPGCPRSPECHYVTERKKSNHRGVVTLVFELRCYPCPRLVHCPGHCPSETGRAVESSKRPTACVMPAVHRNHRTAQIRSPAGGGSEDYDIGNFLIARGPTWRESFHEPARARGSHPRVSGLRRSMMGRDAFTVRPAPA